MWVKHHLTSNCITIFNYIVATIKGGGRERSRHRHAGDTRKRNNIIKLRHQYRWKILRFWDKTGNCVIYEESVGIHNFFAEGLGNLGFLSKSSEICEKFTAHDSKTVSFEEIIKFFVLEWFVIQVLISKTIDEENFTFVEDISTSPGGWSHSSEL